jgi:hypothetical protein
VILTREAAQEWLELHHELAAVLPRAKAPEVVHEQGY